MLPCPAPSRSSLASVSVVLEWVWFDRFSPWMSASPFRIAAGGSPDPSLRPKALHRRPCLDQGAVDAEMLGREQLPNLGIGQHFGEELRGDVTGEQPVAVLGERGLGPRRIVNPDPDKPAEQKVELQALHDLTF